MVSACVWLMRIYSWCRSVAPFASEKRKVKIWFVPLPDEGVTDTAFFHLMSLKQIEGSTSP
jgi:hypothetical protein